MSGRVASNYERLSLEVADKTFQCQRDPDDVTLIAVSKNHSWENVKPAYDAGCRHFGENRVQEAIPKIEEAPQDITWHLIGTLQKNKVRKAVEYFDVIHSVDSVALARKIAEVSQELDLTTSIFLQVNITGEKSKHGFTAEEIKESFYEMYILPGIRIEGLMTMASHLERKEVIAATFRELRYLSKDLGLRELSMGMSDDWKLAVEEGATFIRVGSLIFGER